MIGYLSAAKEWAQRPATPRPGGLVGEPGGRAYYFIGKDNVPFHTMIWPAMLMGYGGLNLPYDVPANQYVTFGGRRHREGAWAARSAGTPRARTRRHPLRIASVLPEKRDTDLSEDEIIRRINDELVATWGNLVNRVLS